MQTDLVSAFRESMANVSAPVTVITTVDDGIAYGSTVSAFSSLSLTPPMVVLALDNRGSLIRRLRSSGAMGVNVMAADQAEIAAQFAMKIPDRFANITYHYHHGLPRIAETAAWLACPRLEFVPGGDHTVVIGHVSHAEPGPKDGLVYYRRTFRSAPGD